MGNASSIDKAMIAIEKSHNATSTTTKDKSSVHIQKLPSRKPKTGLDTGSNHSRKNKTGLDMGSNHSRLSMLSLDIHSNHSRRKPKTKTCLDAAGSSHSKRSMGSGGGLDDKRSTHSCRSNRSRKEAVEMVRGIANRMDECDMDDIFHLVKQLKKDSKGQKLLDEFVEFQTGKSTQKPRLLELACEDDDWSSNDEDEFALAGMEITIGGGDC